jgi:alanine racemase
VDVYIFNYISDAIFARQSGIKKKIIVLYYISSEEALLASEYDLEVTCPNIDWLLDTIEIIGQKRLKLHVYVDSGIGRYGIIEPTKVYELMRKINNYSNLELVGLGTRFNPTTPENILENQGLFKYKPVISQNRKNLFRKYIKSQIDSFDEIIRTSRSQNLITDKTKIHASCSVEVLNKLEDIYYDFVRVGTLVLYPFYKNFVQDVPVLDIKEIPPNFCIGYFCANQITSEKNTVLEVLIKSDPLGLIIPEGLGIRVGDLINIEYELGKTI